MTLPAAGDARRQPVAALVLFALSLVVLWAMMSAGSGSKPPAALGSVGTLGVLACCFVALAFDLVSRLAAVAFGACASLLVGASLGFYTPADAAAYVVGKADTLVLLGGVGLVTGVLAESGFLGRVARRIVQRSQGNGRAVTISLCVVTYALSCFVNNLATILVIVPVSLLVAEALRIDPEPLVLGEVIASNLGGASTMIGDFPNMLIATSVGLPFHEFLFHMAPVCLLQLAVLLALTARMIPSQPQRPQVVNALLDRLEQPFDAGVCRRGQVLLLGVVAGLLIAGEVGLSPAIVAALGGVLALIFGGIPRRALLGRMCLPDIAFFACLFIMVGAVDASGTLNALGRSLADLLRTSPTVGAIAVAWTAAAVTSVLNAGPTTALFVHVLLRALAPRGAGETIWWALSLGVCAGSSATLAGATAGPVAASLMEERGYELTFRGFARTGVPMALVFMAITTGYLAISTR